jgi:hypothetical protein
MILYHYTAPQHLAGIAKHGLTVGDVPTDVRRHKGCVGVWLTTSPDSLGLGLGGPLPKHQYRLTVEVPPTMTVVRWTDWAPGNVTPETFARLNATAGKDGKSQWETWFIRFGVVPPSAIVACRDMIAGVDVGDWAKSGPADGTAMAVPPWRRQAWHKQLLKQQARYLRAVAAEEPTPRPTSRPPATRQRLLSGL